MPGTKLAELMRLEQAKVDDAIYLKVGVEAVDCWAGVERLNLTTTDEYQSLAAHTKGEIVKAVHEAGPKFIKRYETQIAKFIGYEDDWEDVCVESDHDHDDL